MDGKSIVTAELPRTRPDVARSDVATILRDSSMRILEAALALGALTTALLLGLAR